MPNLPPRSDSCAIAIVAKESRPNLSKTRRTPPLTPDEAAAMSSCFLLDTAACLLEAGSVAPIQGPAGRELC